MADKAKRRVLDPDEMRLVRLARDGADANWRHERNVALLQAAPYIKTRNSRGHSATDRCLRRDLLLVPVRLEHGRWRPWQLGPKAYARSDMPRGPVLEQSTRRNSRVFLARALGA